MTTTDDKSRMRVTSTIPPSGPDVTVARQVMTSSKRARQPRIPEPSASWWTGETPIRLTALPNHLPLLPTGRKVSLPTVFRWTTRGLHNVRLRRFKLGGGWCTTAEELNRWSVLQTEAAA
jgi:hypothetical protein